MRHNKKFNHLGRKKAHRDALLANMTISLIMKKRIFTTLAKAKALRMYAEPLINRAKDDSMNNRRLVFSYLQNKYAVSELFREIAQKIGDRPGGYTRILKTGNRLGDNAQMCMIELVDYNENMLKDAATKKTSRTRRSRKKSAATAEGPAAAEAPKTEAPEVVEEVKAETPAAEGEVEAPAAE
ncbi:MAG: 50S ribosomal protein L17 [Bacteroidales bacterium]|nr:50S ribosomal protein L17 [Bacteroidales bacterium]MCD8393874.1 50S ribosomal protein L17 [Bacteroidales bacterium]